MSTLSTGVDVSAEGNEEEDALKTLRGERSKIRNDFAVRILKEEKDEEERERRRWWWSEVKLGHEEEGRCAR